jgi:hypothetical protein
MWYAGIDWADTHHDALVLDEQGHQRGSLRVDHTRSQTRQAEHLFAFHMAGEDARLLHELDGILEDDITSLDDFQCYVKLSLGGHRLPVFSLALDAPPAPDEQLAHFVRLRSRGRDARPAGVVDDLIRASQARQRSASPTKPRAMSRRNEDELPGVAGHAKGEAESTRRHKKRGSGSHEKQEVQAAPVPVHLMYREEEEDVLSREEGDEERGTPNA